MYSPKYTAKVGTASIPASIAPPPGSIMAYLGNIDPDGWVIADGNSRNNANGRYSNLINMSIGYSIGGNYTPPNFQGAFLRGAGTNQTYSSYSGPTLKTSQNHSTQTHSHTVNDTGHAHFFNSFYDNGDGVGGGGTTFGWKPYDDKGMVINDSFNPNQENYKQTPYNVAGNTTGVTINDSSGNTVDTNETRPYNFGVNWIIKL